MTLKSEEKSLSNSNSSKKDLEEREEARRRILEEDPDISKDARLQSGWRRSATNNTSWVSQGNNLYG
ncbi:MAG TPA: hypothetical protein VI278_04210 [Nitrososphaeraceae archaeon]